MTPENAIEFRPRFRGQRFAVKARVRLIDDLGKRKARHQIIHTSIYIQGGVTERVAALGRRVTVHTGRVCPANTPFTRRKRRSCKAKPGSSFRT
jgi:hypothetical protein